MRIAEILSRNYLLPLALVAIFIAVSAEEGAYRHGIAADWPTLLVLSAAGVATIGFAVALFAPRKIHDGALDKADGSFLLVDAIVAWATVGILAVCLGTNLVIGLSTVYGFVSGVTIIAAILIYLLQLSLRKAIGDLKHHGEKKTPGTR